jgi:catechol 2,3-dioxygenase-like lactoylglutathione lyase family enzyme
MDQRMSLVTLGVSDVNRALDFYTAVGWADHETPDGDVIFFQTPGLIVALWGRDKLAEDSAVTDAGGWGGVTFAHCVRSPDEVDAILETAAGAGATIGRPAAETFWGGYSGVFLDPDGHPWEIAHNPAWVVHDDGRTTLR